MPRRIITLTTDFGPGRYVAQMKGVILSLCPDATLVDIAHDVPPHDLVNAAYLLKDVVSTFPEGTIHVVVVDPGVGAKSRGIAVRAGPEAWGQYFVGPDNGVFSSYASGGEARLLENPAYARATVAQVFHGRDVFAPAAAHLANGAALHTFGRLAEPQALSLPEPLRSAGSVIGEVLYADKFGNLVTNLYAVDLPDVAPERLAIDIGWARIGRLSKGYGDVRIGELVALIGSTGRLEIAVREGSAAERLQLREVRGTRVKAAVARPDFVDP